MKAGFQKIDITPPIGTRMSGFGHRDDTGPCDSIHDPLHARVLVMEHEGEMAVIIGFDLLFFSRPNASWIRDAICTRLDLKPSQILLNTSHTHAGPCVDTWHTNLFQPPDVGYLQMLVAKVLLGVLRAHNAMVEVTMSAGTGRSHLPVSRRKPDGKGGIDWLPHFAGAVCRNLPLCLFRDLQGDPICLLYSVSCHPSMIGDRAISADYPGPACDLLDKHLGADCSLFLQGAAGDSKPGTVADGARAEHPGVKAWRPGTWDDVGAAARLVADDVIKVLEKGLDPVEPGLSTVLIEVPFVLEPSPDEAELEQRLTSDNRGRVLLSRHMLEQLKLGQFFATSADLLIQGIRLGEQVRVFAIEAEMVGELGNQVVEACGPGTTFALGYSNGTGLYLPSDRMLPEGGYEVFCHHEYNYAAPLAPGIDERLTQAIQRLGIRN